MADKIMRFIKSIWKPIVLWLVIAIVIFLLSLLIAFLSYERIDCINKIASMVLIVDILTTIFGIPIFVIMKCLKRKLRIFFAIVLLFFVLYIIVGTQNVQAETKIIDIVSQIIAYALLSLFLCAAGMILFFIFKIFQSSTGTYKAGTILKLGDLTVRGKLAELELNDVSIHLNLGESCYFEGDGCSYHTKEIVTSYKNRSYGSSMRIMKGYSVHRSHSQSTAIREKVNTKYPGHLYVTNKRIVFLAEKHGFDIRFENISNITIHNKYIEVFSRGKFYRVFTPHTAFIRDLMTLMNTYH